MKQYLFSLMSLCLFTIPVSKAAIRDVGLVGPAGNITLYYTEGSVFSVKKCQNVVLGSTPAEARQRCQSTPKTMPLSALKKAIRLAIQKINPETVTDEVSPRALIVYREHGVAKMSAEAIASFRKELATIEDFIRAYGEGNADLARRGFLRTILNAYDTIEPIVATIFNLLAYENTLQIMTHTDDGASFTYKVLNSLTFEDYYQCGQAGSIADRLADCSFSANQNANYRLVVSEKQDDNYYQDQKTKLIWGKVNTQGRTLAEAKAFCEAQSSSGLNKWRLPTLQEFEIGNRNGVSQGVSELKKILPKGYSFWSSTLTSRNSRREQAWIFAFYEGGHRMDWDIYARNNVTICVIDG